MINVADLVVPRSLNSPVHPHRSRWGSRCARPRLAFEGSATSRRARADSPGTESRTQTVRQGGSATRLYRANRRDWSRRYERMSGHPRHTPRCGRTSRECVLLSRPVTVCDLEDLWCRRWLGGVARTPAYTSVQIGTHVRTLRSSRRVRTGRKTKAFSE